MKVDDADDGGEFFPHAPMMMADGACGHGGSPRTLWL